MQTASPKTVGDLVTLLFPERRVTIQAAAGDRHYLLSSPRQATIAVVLVAALVWINISLVAVVSGFVAPSAGNRDTGSATPNALDHAVFAGRDDANGIKPTDSPAELAAKIERRHAALSMLISEAHNDPGAAEDLQPAFPALVSDGADPTTRILAVAQDQDRLVAATADFARRRLSRLRGVMTLAGLGAFGFGVYDNSLHGTLITAHDARSLAAEMKVDLDYARRVQTAATALLDLRALADRAERMPLARPVESGASSSGFGPRRDPINGLPHFHAGIDFPGAAFSAIKATADGVVVFTGARSGYGNTVEIDHGGGFWTRYAHLNAIAVTPGQHITKGQNIGGMGSTGHSTGTHLHYEVWQDGQARDPDRFLRAGELIQHAG